MKEMSKEQRSKMVRRWRIRKIVFYTIAVIAIVAGAIMVVKGIVTSPTEEPWRLVTGFALMVVGELIFPDIWKETFSQYLKKKGL